MGRSIDQGLIRELFLDGKGLTVDSIKQGVADYFELSLGELSGSREGMAIRARNIAMYLCSELLGMRSVDIGNAFRKPKVRPAIDSVREHCAIDPSFGNDIKKITDSILGD